MCVYVYVYIYIYAYICITKDMYKKPDGVNVT